MAGRSLSLAAYRALARRGSPTKPDLSTSRPSGDLVWLHLGRAEDGLAILDVAQRLIQQRPSVHVLLTWPPGPRPGWVSGYDHSNILLEPAPEEHPKSVTAFVDHWRPDLGFWVWGGLRPNLLDEMNARQTELHLLAAQSSGFDGRRDRWLPELSRTLMRQFSSATALDIATSARLARLGIQADKISVVPGLQPTGHVLPCEATDLDEMAAHLAGRPVWLAADTDPGEWGTILRAHRLALRSAHRLLLVLNPHSEDDIAALSETIDQEELSYAVWGAGDYPDETTQVLIADLPGELGLWYRLATVSFLGSSLVSGKNGTDPMSAAALGTAILYGPNVATYLANYSRLAAVGAARIVNDSTSLGTAVSRLILPEQAASMAHAGWDVVSEGAMATDMVIDLIQDRLDDVPPTRGAP